MLLDEATNFVNEEFLPIWPKWSETISFYEKQKWIDLFREMSVDAARKCLDRYYDSPDFTMQRPKRYSMKKYIPAGGGGHNFAWIQNTKNGKFYPLYYPKAKDREKILINWFNKHHPDGAWLAHGSDEITVEELSEYRKQKHAEFKSGLAKVGNMESEIKEFCEKYDLPVDDRIEQAVKDSQKKPLWKQVKEVL
jgi:hypothetical protein